MKAISLLILLTSFSGQIYSQWFKDEFRKNQLTFYWGYNRSSYLTSDIHFKGNDYDFVIKNVKAQDFPAKPDLDVYLSPSKFTIPQFNIRLGYFISNNLQLSFGYDHMKYIAIDNQLVLVDGYIDSSISKQHAGYYNGTTDYLEMDWDFILIEHSDGLNYVTTELDYYDSFWKSRNNKFNLDFFVGGGAGFLVPRTDGYFFYQSGNNVYHVAGYGFSGNIGLDFTFLKHFHFKYQGKAGWMNMPNISTIRTIKTDHASQKIVFFEEIFQLGVHFRLKK